MSVAFRAVNWNRQKVVYDLTLAGAVAGMLLVYAAAALLLHPAITAETVLIRVLGIAAFALLHVVLVIGPLARLDRRFLPLLYNRRHLGVTMALLALAHAAFTVVQFEGFGDAPAVAALLEELSARGLPGGLAFELLGAAGLLVLILMAATSHDYWLGFLGSRAWKSLHLAVYGAYALLVGHVALGALRDGVVTVPAVILGLGVLGVAGAHVAAALRVPASTVAAERDGLVDVGAVADLAPDAATVVRIGRRRLALVRHAEGISCVSNVCLHQGGPIGEGRVVDGCITCPWHGYQYRPADGTSPPPFTEKLATYRVVVRDGRILVDPRPYAPGTFVPPAPPAMGAVA